MKKILITTAACTLLILGACDSNNTQDVKQVAESATEANPVTATKQTTAPAEASVTAAATNSELSEYQIDVEGAHAFINAKFMHLGYSVLWATFKEFDGSFMYDANNIENSSVSVNINVASLDSNHEKRDQHMQNAGYLNTAEFPTASFNSTSISQTDNGMLKVSGDLNLHGTTKNISFDAKVIGEGDDPWGGYRVGLEGEYDLKPSEFGMTKFNPDAVKIELYLEGIKKK